MKVISCSTLFDVSIKAVCLGSIKRNSGVSSGPFQTKAFHFFKVALLLCCHVAIHMKEGDVPVVSGMSSYIEVVNCCHTHVNVQCVSSVWQCNNEKYI